MRKRTLIAALAAVALGLGGALAIPLSASAHNLGLDGSAACQADGTYTVTWTGTTHNVPDGDTGVATIKSHTPPASSLSASTIPGIVGNTTFTFTQTGIPGNTNQANVNADIAWTGADEYKQNDVTGHVKLGGDCTVPVVPELHASVTGTVTCDVKTQTYSILWTGTVSGVYPGYVAERVKYTGVTPAVTVVDGVTPGTGFTYTTTVAGSATSASAPFHVHVTQTAAGVDPLDADATGTVTLTGDCTPAAQLCTVTGTPYTEDGFPLFTVDGQRYGDPDASQPAPGHALNWLVPVHGNLQGFTTASYTISAATGYQAAFRFVLFANGTSGYTSVTAEPYLNGWSAGQTGTFTITPATLVWNSHIASGPGSQGSPVSITAMAALIPNNELISEGIHSGSTFVAGQSTTVSAITGCVTFNKPVAPDPIPSITTDNGEVTCSADGGGSYVITTHYFLTYPKFVAPASFTFDGQEPVKSADDTFQTIEVGTDVCPAFVTPEPPTATDLCGTSHDSVTLPGVVGDDGSSETANAHYTVTWSGNTATVIADPLDGFQFNAPGDGDTYKLVEGSAEWTLTLTDVACPTPPTTTLAETGVSINFGIYATIVGALLVIGLALVIAGTYRRRKNTGA